MGFASLPFMDPAIITIIIVIKLITVNILFNIDDSFTPMDNNITSSMTIVKAKKSGYSDKKEISIGIIERIALPMAFPISASI